jgi:chorismate mutase
MAPSVPRQAYRRDITVPVRAVRGATQLDVDEREHLLERVAELVKEVLRTNALEHDDLISIVFTATSDVHSEFPAYAARLMGMTDVPLLCARELEIDGSMPRVIRLMAHVETDLRRDEITHVYLHGAAALRRDLSHVYAAPDDGAGAAGAAGGGSRENG